MIARIEAIETPVDLISRQLKPAVANIEETVKALRDRVEEDAHRTQELDKFLSSALSSAQAFESRITAQQAHVESLADAEQRLTKFVESLAQDFSGLTDVGRQVQEALATAQQAGDLGRSVLSEVEQDSHRVLLSLRRHNEELAAELVRSREMTHRVQDSLVEMADAMVRRLDREEKPTSLATPLTNEVLTHDDLIGKNEPGREHQPDERVDR